jgi:hypothetical protein
MNVPNDGVASRARQFDKRVFPEASLLMDGKRGRKEEAMTGNAREARTFDMGSSHALVSII